MTDPRILIFGAPVAHLPGWQRGAASLVVPEHEWDASFQQGALIDAATGPLDAKRQRLQRWDASGVRRVISAATTATVAAQQHWTGDHLHIIGIDPLLMAAGGHIVTVAGANADDLDWLNTLWPDRDFVGIADAVGHIFTRELLPIINEAADFIARGVTPHDINQATKLGLNYPRGPFQWAELFGWEAVYWGLTALEDMYGPRFRPHPWIRAQVGSSLWDRN